MSIPGHKYDCPCKWCSDDGWHFFEIAKGAINYAKIDGVLVTGEEPKMSLDLEYIEQHLLDSNLSPTDTIHALIAEIRRLRLKAQAWEKVLDFDFCMPNAATRNDLMRLVATYREELK